MATIEQGKKLSDYIGTGFNWRRASIDKPCCTLPKSITFGGYSPIWHPTEHRNFTVREQARIGSFPDEFKFIGGFADATMRVGNSVPPLMVRAIAESIGEKIFMRSITETNGRGKSYVEILNEAWQAHLAPRAPDAPTFISTFSGCGGSSLGYSMAGYRELLAVEFERNAVMTFMTNFPGVPVYFGDIIGLSIGKCMEMAGVKEGELDLLDGSPPCTGFSTSGKRKIGDMRNQLFREFVRLLRGLKPKVFVMENVQGLVQGKMAIIFAEIMRELKTSGYDVSAKLLNAMYFSVPQSRPRMIFIGVRKDFGAEPSHPDPDGGKVISVAEAIGQDGVAIYRGKYAAGGVKKISMSRFDRPSLTLRVVSCAGAHIVETNYQTDVSMDQPAPPLSSEYKKYWENAPSVKLQSVGRFKTSKRLMLDRPSPVITRGDGYGGIYHPVEPRGISTGERKRLSSFPGQFRFPNWDIARNLIGNSVPPLFMRAIARHVRNGVMNGYSQQE